MTEPVDIRSDATAVIELDHLLAKADARDEGYAEDALKGAEILDGLAVKLRDATLRVPLGESGLINLVTKIAGDSATILQNARLRVAQTALLYQAARVAGNLGADCDANRDRLAAAGYPARIIGVLAANADLPLKTLQPIAASLLNLVNDGHRASITALSGHDELLALISTANRLYTPGVWAGEDHDMRAMVAAWFWSIVNLTVDETHDPTFKLTLPAFKAFLPPLLGAMPRARPADLHDVDPEDSFTTDIGLLTHATKVLERFNAKDKVEYEAVLGDKETTTALLDFVDDAAIPPWLDTSGWEDAEGIKKALGVAKADVSRSVVSLLSEGGEVPEWIHERLGQWLEMPGRPDLVSVALLALGNCARGDADATAILTTNPALLPRLVALLDPSTPIIVQHALVGLLRNLAIPVPNKRKLGDAGVLPRLVAMEPWADHRDMLGSVQGGAVGIVKQLVRDETNAVQFLSLTSGVDALHSLITRTNEPPIALEGTRVWVNSTRALGTGTGSQHVSAWQTLGDQRVVDELVAMLTQGARYPVLLNESVLSLTLLVTFGSKVDGEVKVRVVRALMDGESARKVKSENPNAGLEGKSGAEVLAGVVAAGVGAPETQLNAVTLVKILASEEVSGIVREAVRCAEGEVVEGAREL